jgi:ribonucleotide reductase alpha subunit
VIDRNYYPIPESKNSNIKHRPMGIGVQGLADVFAKMKISFDEEKALETNRKIFECI